MADPGDLQTIRFGGFELDLSAGELRKERVKVRLQEQPFRVLQMLLESHGRLVSREQLRAAIWPSNSYIDFDQGLNRAISKLREALGDSAETPQFIETLSKRGYRFVAQITTDPNQVRSLMILPLESLSQDPEQQYFAEGLTDALTTALAKVSALRVISHTTAKYYKREPKPLPELARTLGIDGVIEGSLLRAAGRVRISIQLLHAPTDTHLWAEIYDREMQDVLTLQTEVVNAIVREIRVKLTPQEQIQLKSAPALDSRAYDAYLRGRYHWSKRTSEGSLRAIHSFEEAIACEPHYAAAYAGLADCYGIRGYYGLVHPQEGCAKSKQLALKALAIDPDAAEPHTSLAWALQYYDYDFVLAEQEYRRALELNPRYIVAHYWLSMSLGWQGRFDEAIDGAKHALDLDPLSIAGNPFLSMASLCARRYGDLANHARRTIELYPEFPVSHWALGWACLETAQYDWAISELEKAVTCSGGATLFRAMVVEAYAVSGSRETAQRMLQDLLDDAKHQYVTPYMIARIHTALGHVEHALSSLETGWRERAAWMPFLKVDPRMDPLRSEPGFIDIMRRINFPPPAR